MASILNTDLGELYNTWGERVAFNEGFQRQKISEARQAGSDAFHQGLDRSDARDNYFASRSVLESDAREFLSTDSAVADVDDGAPVDDVGAVSVVDPYQEVADEYGLDLDTEAGRYDALAIMDHPDWHGSVDLQADWDEAIAMNNISATLEDWSIFGNDPEFMEDPDGYMRSL